MRTSFCLLFLVIVAAQFLAGCASKSRSSSTIVEGESSTITYTNREMAGGRIGGRE